MKVEIKKSIGTLKNDEGFIVKIEVNDLEPFVIGPFKTRHEAIVEGEKAESDIVKKIMDSL